MVSAKTLPRVLFVEDEPGLRSAYDRYFGSRYDVALAGSGAEARSQLSSSTPAVVVLDLHLPDTDGIDVFRQIRVDHPDLPVVITTAYTSMQPLVEILGMGHSAYLLKPFTLDELARHINDAC